MYLVGLMFCDETSDPVSATAYVLHSKAQPRFKNVVSIFPSCPYTTNVQLQQSKASRGEKWGRCVPLPSWLRGLGEYRKLSQWDLGRRPSRKWFWGFSCAIFAISCILVHLKDVCKWEILTSLYWLVSLMFSFNFFGLSDTPTWIFGVFGHPRHPQCPCFTAKFNTAYVAGYYNSNART